MIRYTMPQGSPEWRQIRVGKLTASDSKDMLATIKTGEAAARRDLRARLVAERLTGTPQDDSYQSEAMAWGTATEPEARRVYESRHGAIVEEVGFLQHDELAAGCSPDGLVDEGLLEIKCPKTATHIGYLKDGIALVATYRAQITHALWVSGAPWLDIVSYDPRLPEKLRMVSARVDRSSVDLTAHEAEVRKFLVEVDRDVAALQGWGVFQEA